jgi:hypothetical protein
MGEAYQRLEPFSSPKRVKRAQLSVDWKRGARPQLRDSWEPSFSRPAHPPVLDIKLFLFEDLFSRKVQEELCNRVSFPVGG